MIKVILFLAIANLLLLIGFALVIGYFLDKLLMQTQYVNRVIDKVFNKVVGTINEPKEL